MWFNNNFTVYNYFYKIWHVIFDYFSRNLKMSCQLLLWREMDFSSHLKFYKKNIKVLSNSQWYVLIVI